MAGSLISGGLPAAAASAQDTILTVLVAGKQRTACLHLPPSFEPGSKYSLLVGYHGGGGNALGYIQQAQLFAKAEREGFIVICPEGTPLRGMAQHRVWNSGPEYATSSDHADDVAFTRLLIEQVSSVYPVDSKRIYATGFSNGAQMSYRVAVEMSGTIAAIAAMSGGRLANRQRPGRAVPVLHIHGTADGPYPLSGGRGPYSIGSASHVPVDAIILEWCKFNGAALTPQTRSHAGWEIQIHDGPAPVVLVLVNGLGHQIAGGRDDRLPRQALLAMPDAVAMALQFCHSHPMP